METKRNNELWNKAKQIIPGGTQLLSKRSEQFLPNQWPSFYKKAKGVEIWDLDDNKYIDMSLMGVGTCTLGYADNDINEAVKRAIEVYSDGELWEKLMLRAMSYDFSWAHSAGQYLKLYRKLMS